MRMIMAYLRDARGATAIEYGLIAALISVALIGGFGGFSDAFLNTYTLLADEVRISD